MSSVRRHRVAGHGMAKEGVDKVTNRRLRAAGRGYATHFTEQQAAAEEALLPNVFDPALALPHS